MTLQCNHKTYFQKFLKSRLVQGCVSSYNVKSENLQTFKQPRAVCCGTESTKSNMPRFEIFHVSSSCGHANIRPRHAIIHGSFRRRSRKYSISSLFFQKRLRWVRMTSKTENRIAREFLSWHTLKIFKGQENLMPSRTRITILCHRREENDVKCLAEFEIWWTFGERQIG